LAKTASMANFEVDRVLFRPPKPVSGPHCSGLRHREEGRTRAKRDNQDATESTFMTSYSQQRNYSILSIALK
jgi:hypothetical protein